MLTVLEGHRIPRCITPTYPPTHLNPQTHPPALPLSLSQVTHVTTGKQNFKPLDGYPSLCGASVAVWYRVVLEELQVCFLGRLSGG